MLVLIGVPIVVIGFALRFNALPVIALLERNGLKEQAKRMISRVHAATTGRRAAGRQHAADVCLRIPLLTRCQ